MADLLKGPTAPVYISAGVAFVCVCAVVLLSMQIYSLESERQLLASDMHNLRLTSDLVLRHSQKLRAHAAVNDSGDNNNTTAESLEYIDETLLAFSKQAVMLSEHSPITYFMAIDSQASREAFIREMLDTMWQALDCDVLAETLENGDYISWDSARRAYMCDYRMACGYTFYWRNHVRDLASGDRHTQVRDYLINGSFTGLLARLVSAPTANRQRLAVQTVLFEALSKRVRDRLETMLATAIDQTVKWERPVVNGIGYVASGSSRVLFNGVQNVANIPNKVENGFSRLVDVTVDISSTSRVVAICVALSISLVSITMIVYRLVPQRR